MTDNPIIPKCPKCGAICTSVHFDSALAPEYHWACGNFTGRKAAPASDLRCRVSELEHMVDRLRAERADEVRFKAEWLIQKAKEASQ